MDGVLNYYRMMWWSTAKFTMEDDYYYLLLKIRVHYNSVRPGRNGGKKSMSYVSNIIFMDFTDIQEYNSTRKKLVNFTVYILVHHHNKS